MHNTDKLLSPIVSRSKGDLVLELLTSAIIDGRLSAGDRLPSERQVAAETGVSRAIVREAMSALAVAGLVERREGEGSFVCETSNPGILRTRAMTLIQMDCEPFTILTARELFEPQIAGLVVDGATADDVKEILRAHDGLQSALKSRDWEAYFNSDKQFHTSLSLATHNACVIHVLDYLESQMFSPLWKDLKRTYFESSSRSITVSRATHAQIAGAVQERDSVQLRTSLERHFSMLWRVLDLSDEGQAPKGSLDRVGRKSTGGRGSSARDS